MAKSSYQADSAAPQASMEPEKLIADMECEELLHWISTQSWLAQFHDVIRQGLFPIFRKNHIDGSLALELTIEALAGLAVLEKDPAQKKTNPTNLTELVRDWDFARIKNFLPKATGQMLINSFHDHEARLKALNPESSDNAPAVYAAAGEVGAAEMTPDVVIQDSSDLIGDI